MFCSTRAMPMPSNIPISPFQLLISIFTLIFLTHPPPFSAGPVAKPGCQDRCGDLMIPYPFGVGSNCSFDSSFDITCNGSTVSPKAYLSVFDTEVMEINETYTYIRVKSPNLVSVCHELSGMNVTGVSHKQSKSMNLSGTPYTLFYGEHVITAIGCDDMVMQSNGSLVSGGCSAFCADRNNTGGVGYCVRNDSSVRNGCCTSDIYGYGGTSFVAAELIDTSGNFRRRKLFPCSYAFIQEKQRDAFGYPLEFSYPLYYLDNSTAFLNDNWASTTNPPVVRLGWSLGSENCSRAQLSRSSYACQDNKSVCFDYTSNEYYYGDDGSKGYVCKCVEGYEGNPYLSGGCQAISFSSSSIAKPGCQDQCGEISIPFPFGIGPNCYLDPSFEIICNASTNPPIPYLPIFMARIIELTNSSQVLIYYPNSTGLACYNMSESDYHHGMKKTEEHSLIIDLLGTQYTVSHGNWITAIGCDDMMVGIVGQQNQRFFDSCSSVCWEGASYAIRCSVGSQGYYDYVYGCCTLAIPRGTSFQEANLSDLSGQWKRKKFFPCSRVFLQYYDNHRRYYSFDFPLEYLNTSTEMQIEDYLPQSIGKLMLDWRIGQGNCKEARQNHTSFACKENSECVDFDSVVGG